MATFEGEPFQIEISPIHLQFNIFGLLPTENIIAAAVAHFWKSGKRAKTNKVPRPNVMRGREAKMAKPLSLFRPDFSDQIDFLTAALFTLSVG